MYELVLIFSILFLLTLYALLMYKIEITHKKKFLHLANKMVEERSVSPKEAKTIYDMIDKLESRQGYIIVKSAIDYSTKNAKTIKNTNKNVSAELEYLAVVFAVGVLASRPLAFLTCFLHMVWAANYRTTCDLFLSKISGNGSDFTNGNHCLLKN